MAVKSYIEIIIMLQTPTLYLSSYQSNSSFMFRLPPQAHQDN